MKSRIIMRKKFEYRGFKFIIRVEYCKTEDEINYYTVQVSSTNFNNYYKTECLRERFLERYILEIDDTVKTCVDVYLDGKPSIKDRLIQLGFKQH